MRVLPTPIRASMHELNASDFCRTSAGGQHWEKPSVLNHILTPLPLPLAVCLFSNCLILCGLL